MTLPPGIDAVLQRPPLKLIHDIVAILTARHKFAPGLYSPVELNFEKLRGASGKDAKVLFVEKLLTALQAAKPGAALPTVKDVLAGRQPVLVNATIQLCVSLSREPPPQGWAAVVGPIVAETFERVASLFGAAERPPTPPRGPARPIIPALPTAPDLSTAASRPLSSRDQRVQSLGSARPASARSRERDDDVVVSSARASALLGIDLGRRPDHLEDGEVVVSNSRVARSLTPAVPHTPPSGPSLQRPGSASVTGRPSSSWGRVGASSSLDTSVSAAAIEAARVALGRPLTSSGASSQVIRSLRNEEAQSAAGASDPLLRAMTAERRQREEELLLAAEAGDLSRVSMCLGRGPRPPSLGFLREALSRLSRCTGPARLDPAGWAFLESATRDSMGVSPVFDARGMSGFTPLHYACRRAHPLVSWALLTAGANPNSIAQTLSEDGQEETPLLLAAEAGDVASVAILLAHGANANTPSTEGTFPLHAAASCSNPVAVLRELCLGGANVTVRDRLGDSAEEIASDPSARALLVSPPSPHKLSGLSLPVLLRVMGMLDPAGRASLALTCSRMAWMVRFLYPGPAKVDPKESAPAAEARSTVELEAILGVAPSLVGGIAHASRRRAQVGDHH
jgi:hypothetical protein